MTASGRVLLVGVTLALHLAPPAALAQPGKVPRIGLLESGSLAGRAPLWEAFRRGMRELGYIEGQTVVFEARGGDGRSEQLQAAGGALVQIKVDVIVTSGSGAAQVAHRATIPPMVLARADELIE